MGGVVALSIHFPEGFILLVTLVNVIDSTKFGSQETLKFSANYIKAITTFVLDLE